MAARRRTQWPGLQPRTQQELTSLQDELIADNRALREEVVGHTTNDKTSGVYGCRFSERVRCLPVAAGLDLVFPEPSPVTANRWIEVAKLGGGNVRIRPTKGLVQGVSLLTLTNAGLYYFSSDGVSSWWAAPIGGGGLSPPIALTDIAAIPDQTWLGNVSGGVASPSPLTQAQLKTFIGVFGAATTGLVPASGGGTTNFLRADGTFAAPGGGGAVAFSSQTVNLGTIPRYSGFFQFTGLVGLTIGKDVLVQQAPGPYTGKGTQGDEAEEGVIASGVVATATTINCQWSAVGSPVAGNVRFFFLVSA